MKKLTTKVEILEQQLEMTKQTLDRQKFRLSNTFAARFANEFSVKNFCERIFVHVSLDGFLLRHPSAPKCENKILKSLVRRNALLTVIALQLKSNCPRRHLICLENASSICCHRWKK